MITKRYTTSAALTLVLAGCALLLTVRQEDLDAWVGMPIEALDTHSFFITLPLAKTITSSGIEIRNYPNKRNIGRCFGSGNINASGYMYFATYSTFATCSSELVGCDNIFYIKNGVVVEYAPTGHCYTDETVRPQSRFQRLIIQ